jgi:hypothetical protein
MKNLKIHRNLRPSQIQNGIGWPQKCHFFSSLLVLLFSHFVPSDKTLLALMMVALLVLLRRVQYATYPGHHDLRALAPLALAGVIAAFKWVTIFALPAMAWQLGKGNLPKVMGGGGIVPSHLYCSPSALGSLLLVRI